MKVLVQIRNRCNNTKIILISGLLYTISQIIIIRILSPIGPENVFLLQTSFSADYVENILKSWDSSGLTQIYLSHFFLDFPHPIWYGLFFTALSSKLLQKSKMSSQYNRIILIPITAAFLDLFENISHIFFIKVPATITPVWVFVSGSASCLKWLFSLTIITICMVLFLRLITRSAIKDKILNRRENK